MHYLNTGQLIQVALNADIDGARTLTKVIEQAQAKLAEKVAHHFDVQHISSIHDIESLESDFAPAHAGQICPEALADHDESSDWVETPDEIDVPIAMIVLYRDHHKQRGTDVPMAFRCIATDFEHAERLCVAAIGPSVEVLWVTDTNNVNVAIDSYWRGDDPRHELADLKPSTPPVNEAEEILFIVQDVEPGFEEATGQITLYPLGFGVRINGYTDNSSTDDSGELFILTKDKNKITLHVFSDVNAEEATHTVSLEGARNVNREILNRA